MTVSLVPQVTNLLESCTCPAIPADGDDDVIDYIIGFEQLMQVKLAPDETVILLHPPPL